MKALFSSTHSTSALNLPASFLLQEHEVAEDTLFLFHNEGCSLLQLTCLVLMLLLHLLKNDLDYWGPKLFFHHFFLDCSVSLLCVLEHHQFFGMLYPGDLGPEDFCFKWSHIIHRDDRQIIVLCEHGCLLQLLVFAPCLKNAGQCPSMDIHHHLHSVPVGGSVETSGATSVDPSVSSSEVS